MSRFVIRPTLCLSRSQAVLVGDPKQLPATVLSKLAGSKHLAQSLFERLERVRR